MLCVVLLLACGTASAGALHTIDGRRVDGTLASIDTGGKLVWVTIENKRLVMSTDEVQQIDLTPARTQTGGPSSWLVTAGDMRLRGRVVRSVEAKVVWEHKTLGQMSFGFEQLRAYLPEKAGRTDAEALKELERLMKGEARTISGVQARLERLVEKVREPDVVYLLNEDVIEGVVESLDADSVGFNCKVGRLDVRGENLVGLTFSDSLAPYVAPKTTYARLTLTDGTVVTGSVKGSDAELHVVTVLGPELDVARNAVSRVELFNTKLKQLSDMDPVFVKEIPYFDRVWHWQRNRSVWNGPLTIASQTYESGIGMHARCQLDYQLDGKYRIFLTDVGIDEEVGDAGSCVVVVYGDGEPLMKPIEMTGKMGAYSLRLDVSKVKRLTLLADFGQQTDAGDHVTWGNARLVRK